MRPLLVLAVLYFTILAEAQNFSTYVPECVPPCIEQTLDSSKVCTGLDDNACLCTNASQILFPSIGCFITTCNSTNPGELRSEVTSGWTKFCNASGTPVDLSSDSNFGGPGGWKPTASTTSSPTPSIPPTSTSAPSPSPTASDVVTDTSSGLSTGAKAGIGVGAGVGSLAVISGLVFLGFRLGQRKKKGSGNDTEGTPPFNEGEHPEDGRGTVSGTNTTGTTPEGTEEHWYKVQQEGAVLAELPSPDAELPANEVGELATHERPAELSGVMPPELSAEGEVRRHRT
ncbi:hypothetical protein F4803DRAFT_388124 [Xylaria telfairii]|nr:hypothetical protein F4803DRAFT_388124 [Xylaria telfairii]